MIVFVAGFAAGSVFTLALAWACLPDSRDRLRGLWMARRLFG